MASWINTERRKSLRSADFEDIARQLSAAASYLGQLTRNTGEETSRQIDQARDVFSDAASDAHETLRENAVASVVLAAGVGLVVGYLIGRSSDWES